LPLDAEHALKLTTARYFTPSGRSIQAQGITPDIIVRPGTLTQDETDGYYKESDLAGALENPNGDEGESEEAAAEGEEVEEETAFESFDPTDDYQLYQAITLLKGIAILNASR